MSEISFPEVRTKMEKAITVLMADFQSIGSSRAHPGLIENLPVIVYGQKMPLKGVASITIIDSQTLSVAVWDKGNVGAVDKAVRTANLNLNPRIDGDKLLVSIPPMTTEGKKEFIKIAKAKSEEAKISIRNQRRIANDALKKSNKYGSIDEDELEGSLKKIQAITDTYIKKVEDSFDNKEKNLLEF